MEVLSPLRFGPERVQGFDRAKHSFAEPWFRPSLETTCSFGPRAPPSPPQEMSSNRLSLPSIADILNPEGEDDRPRGKRKACSPDEDERSRKEPRIRGGAKPTASGSFPPTPPLGSDVTRNAENQPLPTLQPVHVSRIPSASFSPDSRYKSTTYSTTQEPNSAASNTNMSSVLSPTPMSAPPPESSPIFSQSRKRRSDAEHTRRSRSPPVFYSRPSRPSDPSAPPTVSSTSAHRSHRSASSDFYSQQSYTAQSQRLYGGDVLPPTSPPTSATASLPSSRSLNLEYAQHSQQHPQNQSLYQPYSPQSSPSSTHTTSYDARVRSSSWAHPGSHPASAPAQTPATQHAVHSPASVVSGSTAGAAADRYICPTCGKCFSRPSSLRIHSHSHTGEKPFRCSREGCGKAFSVRSNMKRHEKGCHASGVIVGGGPHSSGFSGSGPHGGGFHGGGPPPGSGSHGPRGGGGHSSGHSSGGPSPGGFSGAGAPGAGGGHLSYSTAPRHQHHGLPSVAPVLPVPSPPGVGLGVRGLPSLASTLPRPRELAPALDAS